MNGLPKAVVRPKEKMICSGASNDKERGHAEHHHNAFKNPADEDMARCNSFASMFEAK